MKLNINIHTNNKCKIIIEDLSEYRPESSLGLVAKLFKYSETASIVIIEHIKAFENNIIDNPVIKVHDRDNITLPIKFDGYFKVQYIVIPNLQWFELELSRESGSALNDYKIIYFTDGIYIYKYFPETKEPPRIVFAEELVERNPTEEDSISKIESEHVSICHILKCYVDLCKLIFDKSNLAPCFSKENIDDLIYKRDLVWMTINVVTYLVSLCQLNEAERYIELINGCNGVCKQNKKSNNDMSCGCCK